LGQTVEVTCHFTHHTHSSVLSTGLLTAEVDLGHLPKEFVRRHHHKVPLFSSMEEVTIHSPRYRVGILRRDLISLFPSSLS
jgi:hypothetical protein